MTGPKNAAVLGAWVFAILALLPTRQAVALTCTADSGPRRVALLELYTSEGCDSCPPADKWVAALPGKGLDSTRLVALAFHVDYWNYIGWADPYAQAGFSNRQRQHSTRRGATFVYTPQLLVNGQDYRRGLLFDDIEQRVGQINRGFPLADIKLAIDANERRWEARVEVTPRQSPGGAALYMAMVENNLVTAVKAGENKGRTLRHDAVVRDLAGPWPLDGRATSRHEHTFTLDSRWKPQDVRLIAFVQHGVTGDVWQALSTACQK